MPSSETAPHHSVLQSVVPLGVMLRIIHAACGGAPCYFFRTFLQVWSFVRSYSLHPFVEQDGHRGALQQAIITSIRARIRGDENRIKSPCLGVAWAKDRQSLLGYAFGNTRNFLQIYLAMPSLLPKVKARREFWALCNLRICFGSSGSRRAILFQADVCTA